MFLTYDTFRFKNEGIYGIFKFFKDIDIYGRLLPEMREKVSQK
jgi:hypothetical protein